MFENSAPKSGSIEEINYQHCWVPLSYSRYLLKLKKKKKNIKANYFNNFLVFS